MKPAHTCIHFGLLFLLTDVTAAQQALHPCNGDIMYENHNQVDPRALSLRGISGKAVDSEGIAIPGVCVALFTEQQRLVSTVSSNEEGRFQLKQVAPGSYRLVAKYNGFCVANVPLRVVAWPAGGVVKRRRIVLHMRPTLMHQCGYADYK